MRWNLSRSNLHQSCSDRLLGGHGSRSWAIPHPSPTMILSTGDYMGWVTPYLPVTAKWLTNGSSWQNGRVRKSVMALTCHLSWQARWLQPSSLTAPLAKNPRLVCVTRDLKVHEVPAPCRGRDTIHCLPLLPLKKGEKKWSTEENHMGFTHPAVQNLPTNSLFYT